MQMWSVYDWIADRFGYIILAVFGLFIFLSVLSCILTSSMECKDGQDNQRKAFGRQRQLMGDQL